MLPDHIKTATDCIGWPFLLVDQNDGMDKSQPPQPSWQLIAKNVFMSFLLHLLTS